jgi:glyoxylase-like metal-dependent hydrolase (beta-lactamase superfamily II)
MKSVKNVRLFPLERHELEPGVEVIPIPGHRPGGVGYLVTLAERKYLFAGDGLWHDGKSWKAFPSKAGRTRMIESVKRLADVEFDVLLANTRVENPVCSIELTEVSRRTLMETIVDSL